MQTKIILPTEKGVSWADGNMKDVVIHLYYEYNVSLSSSVLDNKHDRQGSLVL